jgi:hypothetical protein
MMEEYRYFHGFTSLLTEREAVGKESFLRRFYSQPKRHARFRSRRNRCECDDRAAHIGCQRKEDVGGAGVHSRAAQFPITPLLRHSSKSAPYQMFQSEIAATLAPIWRANRKVRPRPKRRRQRRAVNSGSMAGGRRLPGRSSRIENSVVLPSRPLPRYSAGANGC